MLIYTESYRSSTEDSASSQITIKCLYKTIANKNWTKFDMLKKPHKSKINKKTHTNRNKQINKKHSKQINEQNPQNKPTKPNQPKKQTQPY